MVTRVRSRGGGGGVEARRRGPTVLLVVAAALAVAAVAAAAAPIGVVIGASRLVALATMAVGTWVLVARGGAVELGAGAMAGAGAVAGGIGASELGVSVTVALPLAALAGAAVGATTGVLHGRLGRHLGAVTSLTVGVVVVAVWRGLPSLGGRAGFHGVPFLAGSDRPSLVVATAVLAVVVVVAHRVASTVAAARGAVAVGAPGVAEVLGGGAHDAALLGAAAGAMVGVGGAVAAAVGGSAVADAHGASLGILLALAATLGRRSATTAAIGAVALWGPGIVWPLAPLVGTASPWITTGLVALGWLAVRTRPDVEVAPHAASPTASGPEAPPSDASGSGPRPAVLPPTPALPGGRVEVDGVALPATSVDLACRPGTVTAVVGPNGAGKSTLLAVLGGQHPGPVVRLDGQALGRGARRRADAGVGRTWQQPPDVHPDDLVAAATGPGAEAAAAWARHVLGPAPGAARPRRAHAALVALAAGRPRLALLDEPAAWLPPAPVAAFLRGLADGGAVVVVVEHRNEVVAVADDVVPIERPDVHAAVGQEPGLRERPTRSGRAGTRLRVEGGGLGDGGVDAEPGAVTTIPPAAAAILRGDAPGTVRWGERDVSRWSTAHRARAGLVVLGDAPVAPDVSVGDHLAVLVDPAAARDLLASAPLLAGRADDPAGWLSGGERQVLSWLQTIAATPGAVVLDGAARGLDDTVLAWASAVVARWRDDGVVVLVRPGRAEEAAWAGSPGPAGTAER